MSLIRQPQPDRTVLGDPLNHLIDAMDVKLVRADEITTVPSNTLRSTYRLTFENGKVLKGRYFKSKERAALAEQLGGDIKVDWLPGVLARCDQAILETWITGQPLTQGRVDFQTIEQIGQMLGTLHRQPIPPLDDTGFVPFAMTDWIEQLQQCLLQLVEAKLLSLEYADQLKQLAMTEQPSDLATSVVHRDLCPENLVRDDNGKLFSIDNGSMVVGSIEEDLCRVWYRWPMNTEEQQAFAQGYRKHGDPSGMVQPSLFWRIVVITKSACVRLVQSKQAANTALARLNEFAPCQAGDSA